MRISSLVKIHSGFHPLQLKDHRQLCNIVFPPFNRPPTSTVTFQDRQVPSFLRPLDVSPISFKFNTCLVSLPVLFDTLYTIVSLSPLKVSVSVDESYVLRCIIREDVGKRPCRQS
jgi:hypothetical protein